MRPVLPDNNIQRRSYIKAAGGAAAALGIAGCFGNGDGNGDGLTLTMADPWPTNHHVHRFYVEPYIETLEQEAETDVEVEHHPAGQLGESGEMMSLARDEVADIVQVPPSYFSAELQLNQVANLPATFLSTEVATQAYWDILNGVLEQESDGLGLTPVGACMEPPYQLQIVEDQEQITELEDFQGKSIRSAGGIMSTTIESLGASPVEIAPEDLYSAGERGTVEGYLLGENTLPVFDLVPLLDYCTTNVNTGSFANPWFMSQDRFDQLSGDVQEAIITAQEEVGQQYGADVDQEIEELHEGFGDEGVESYAIEDGEYQRWEDAMEPAQDEWINEMEDRDLPGQEVFDAWLDAIEQNQ